MEKVFLINFNWNIFQKLILNYFILYFIYLIIIENLNDEEIPFEIYRLGQSNITFIPNNINQKNKINDKVDFNKLNSKLQNFDISIDENQSAENYSNSKIYSTSNVNFI